MVDAGKREADVSQMIARLTSKGRVTIPKQIRDALDLRTGCVLQIATTQGGDVVIHKVGASRKPDRFDDMRGIADIKWRTDDLMALLRTD